jgi:hypothetical protein
VPAPRRPIRFLVVVPALAALAVGCRPCYEVGEPYPFPWLGRYPAPPPGLERMQIAVPGIAFTEHGREDRVGCLDGAMLGRFAEAAGRFHSVDGWPLRELRGRTDWNDVVKDGELVRRGEIRGVEGVLLARIGGLRVRSGPGPFDHRVDLCRITIDCDVEMRLVDPIDGTEMAAQRGRFELTDTIHAFRIRLAADPGGELRIQEHGLPGVADLALDGCLRSMLPEIDRRLQSTPRRVHAAPPPPPPEERRLLCPNCRSLVTVTGGSHFCPECGNKLR